MPNRLTASKHQQGWAKASRGRRRRALVKTLIVRMSRSPRYPWFERQVLYKNHQIGFLPSVYRKFVGPILKFIRQASELPSVYGTFIRQSSELPLVYGQFGEKWSGRASIGLWKTYPAVVRVSIGLWKNYQNIRRYQN